jgi:cyclohexadienyl dehydratase
MILGSLTGIATALLMSFGAFAHDTSSRLDDILTRGTLRVGITGDYVPFTYLDKSTRKYRGFDVDMAEALGRAPRVRVQYVETA